ncbi:MAG: photosynthetic complex assembly protein PuhC [Pseudomonadota bacterium]
MNPREEFRQHRVLPFTVIGAILLFGLFVAFEGRSSGPIRDILPPGDPLQSRALIFEDHAKGVVAVRDAETGAPLQFFYRGEGMFLRSAMRSFAANRRDIDVGPETPFDLAAWPGGKLTLRDPATGRVMTLTAFGEGNAETFRKYLEPDDQS